MYMDDTVSAAAARVDDHVLVVLDDDPVVGVDVQHRDGVHLGRDAAGPRRGARVHRVDERLDHGVVGGVEVVGHVERTVAGAVERLVAGRRHDPVVPADLAEVDVQRRAAAARGGGVPRSRPAPSTAARRPPRVTAAAAAAANVGRDGTGLRGLRSAGRDSRLQSTARSILLL